MYPKSADKRAKDVHLKLGTLNPLSVHCGSILGSARQQPSSSPWRRGPSLMQQSSGQGDTGRTERSGLFLQLLPPFKSRPVGVLFSCPPINLSIQQPEIYSALQVRFAKTARSEGESEMSASFWVFECEKMARFGQRELQQSTV